MWRKYLRSNLIYVPNTIEDKDPPFIYFLHFLDLVNFKLGLKSKFVCKVSVSGVLYVTNCAAIYV